jgi:hypothetical protein
VPTDVARQLDPAELTGCLHRYLVEKAQYAVRGIDYGGLTSRLATPLARPARVRFRDVATGQWLEGVSEPKIDINDFRIDLTVKAFDPCRFKSHWGRACGCQKRLIGVREGPANLLTNVLANLIRAGILGTTTTITDTGGTGRSVTKTLDGGAVSASTLICAGTGGTSATVADTNMQTQTESQANPTINTVSGSGASGTFTVVGTITATADRAYSECGIKIQTTTTSWVFLIAHDSFSVLNVSSSGTLQITYTFTNS